VHSLASNLVDGVHRDNPGPLAPQDGRTVPQCPDNAASLTPVLHHDVRAPFSNIMVGLSVLRDRGLIRALL
jgi:hypothetical protein